MTINLLFNSCRRYFAIKRVLSFPRPLIFTARRMASKCDSDYVLPNNQPVVLLDCNVAFNALTKEEKLYAHHLSRACWNGGLIVLIQTSPESPLIFVLLHKIFSAESISDLKTKVTPHVSEDDFTAFLVYSAAVFTNAGNYKGFGDTKFIPNLPETSFECIVKNSGAYNNDSQKIERLWSSCKVPVYSLKENVKHLGYPNKALTTYFSSNFTSEDVEIFNQYLKERHIEAYNTRARKLEQNGSPPIYEVLFAAVQGNTKEDTYVKDGKTYNFVLKKSDYNSLLAKVNEDLELAKKFVSNDSEQSMLNEYISSFRDGLLDAHKNGSRYWIKNKSPIIETYIGFIETYRDPHGSRGEFEGFVAVVNKEMSKKFTELVTKAEELIPLLPWPAEFEKDTFQKPDFTSLDVLTFAGSGIPCGINIPNYDEIRQNEGFKNVSLGNVIPSGFKDCPFPFISAQDRELVLKHAVTSFEVQVGLHELLGHGSGKLFHRLANGAFDFDFENIINPIDGKQIASWYKEGETYDSVFTSLGSAYEECRAECVGLYLSLLPQVISIFLQNEEDITTITYVNWLLLVNNGVEKALEMYQPSTKTWLQAHSQARFVIMRVLLEAGKGLLTVKETEENKKLQLTLDREKLTSVGGKAIAEFLIKLQVYKSTGDFAAAKQLFDKYSEVSDDGPYPWSRWRNIVLEHKQPRRLFIQHNSVIEDGGDVKLKNYDATLEGLIQSWVDRFPKPDDIYDSLEHLAELEKPYFNYI